MRAVRLFALLFAPCLVGLALIRHEGLLPAALQFVGPLLADPKPTVEAAQHPEVEPPEDPPHAAAASPSPAGHNLPSFVPESRSLTFSSENDAASSEPDGKPSPATTGSTDPAPTPGARQVDIKVEPISGATKAPAWPQFIGANTLFGAVKKPVPLAARAIGYYAHGCLSGAVPLPIDGPAWQEMRLSRNRNWGHPELIALIERFAKDAQKLDGWPGLLVGDIAQPRGGPMLNGHASHQVGLDADIWLTPMPERRLTPKEREDIQATSMLDKTELAVDPKVFTDKQVALIKRAASYPEVERIFVHPAIKKALCEAAGTDRKWLGKVRPYYGHYYHFHMRIKCPAGFAGCKSQVPPTGNDGCGKEVDQWLARVIPAKGPPHSPPSDVVNVRPPKPPVMLADLPAECRSLLTADPDPVPVPQKALMTKAAVHQALKKAAAARVAFAKAAGFTIVPATAAAAAASPALGPHMRKTKTVAAEKK
ncbi:MAG TPA: penicillin-insensitive murein endopeptidase [Hyphomicrobium sp.]|jgi:penicillin-insensitive murein endopeptidase